MLLAAAAQAQTSPYYLGAAVSRSHDSNIFRLPQTLGPQSDSFTTRSALAGLDKPLGRQRIFTDIAVRQQRFGRLQELDNTGHGATAGLDWETVGRFSGQVKAGTDKSLASYGSPFAASALHERNIQRERTFNASVQRGTVRSTLQPFVAYNARKTEYSAPAYRFRDNERRGLRAGVRWRPSDRLTVGAAAVGARGKYPYPRVRTTAQALPDEYTSRGMEFTGDWSVSGASRLDGRIAYEQRRYELASRRDFSGLNGLLRWQWQPTGKLAFTTSLLRDADDSDRFVGTDVTDLAQAGSRVTNSAMVDGTWSVTAKVSVNAKVRYSKRKLVNPSVDASGGVQNLQGSDTTRLSSVGLTWAATRNLSAGCNLGRQSRSTDSSLSFPFKASTVNCEVQALLR
ncbi:hypothetical protein [Azohydromonas caseinilytica]|uniref:Exopolysaccharide biosynthesis operon protein EpsL n=1 Tax=Azohydromonas caseinilytica TaxID=2728836 RepID=A0A848FCU3_9BURK|nr:hypothetical protein [Azohydromonas caseinilytica]NML17294.1 hypothetical protein [Azohydromonas caseinilytica]